MTIRIIYGNKKLCAEAFNMTLVEFEQKLTHCAPQFVLATCERLKQHNMIFEVQTQNHTLHSGISTFFEDLQRLQ